MTKPFMSVDVVNALAYELAHDLDLREKAWIIPALKSYIKQYGRERWSGFDRDRCERYIDQWIAVRRGELNPVPGSLP